MNETLPPPVYLSSSYYKKWLLGLEDMLVDKGYIAAREVAAGIAHFQGKDNLLKRLSALLAFDATSDLAAIQTPALIAASRDDVLVPFTRSQHLAEKMPKATLWLTAEGGHGFTVTDPAPFNAAMLTFLAENALS